MMASRSQQHRKFVLYKLDFLEQQRSHVHDVVDTYVNKVVDKTKGWLDNTGGQQLTSHDLNQLIDSAVMFLVDKATQIEEGDEETLVTEISQTEMSPSLETQKTSSTDLTLSLASHSGGGDTKELVARLETLEKTVSSLHNQGEELENLSAKQAIMEDNLAQIKTDQSEQSENIEHILSQISSMENNQQIRIKKLKTKIGDVTKNLETVKKSQRTMIADVEEKVDSLSEKMEEMKDKIVKDLDGQMKTLSGQVAEIKEEMTDGDKKLGDEIKDLEHRLSDVSDKVTHSDAAIQEMSSKITEIDTATEKMSTKIAEIDTTTEKLSEKLDKAQEKDGEKIKQLEIKVLAAKRRRKKDFKDVETRYDNVELQYKMVCSIVADRLLGLERLRDILNKKILARDQMANTTLPVTGFKAQSHCRLPWPYTTIKNYQTVETNHGGHFDPVTGRYTIPVDGKYHVTFSTDHQRGWLYLHHVKVSDKRNTIICKNDSSPFDKGVLQATHEGVMCRGDTLYLVGRPYFMSVINNVTVRFSVSYLG